MNPTLERCRAVATHPLSPWVLAFILIAIAALLWNREKRLRFGAEAAAEAAQLALKQQIVEQQSSKAELQESMKDLLGQNELLREAYEKAVSVAPDAKPESASRLETGPLPLRGVPRSPRPAAPAPSSTPPSASAPELQPACYLTAADRMSISVDVLELKTRKGNTLIVGTASASRESPHELLAAGKFESSLSTTRELAESAPPRWGALVLGACGWSGCGPGVGILLPPVTLPLVGWRIEALVGAIAASGGVLAIGGIGGRW